MRKPAGFQTALITGAGSGLGQAVAERLASTVPNLVLWDLNERGLEQSLELCQTAGCAEVRRVDIADTEAVSVAFSELERRGLVPDLIFHAAGVLETGDLDQVTPASCRRMVEVNYLGTVNVLLTAAPLMKAGSRILCMASIAGLKGLPELPAYVGSKFAVVGFCEALHGDLQERGIDLSIVCPPAIDTPMVRNLTNRPALYDLFPFAPKEKVVGHILDAIAQRKRFLILVDLQSRLLTTLNGLLPGMTSKVIGGMIRRKRAARAKA